MIFRVLPKMLLGREERVPRQPLGPFRTDSSIYATAPASGLRVTWFGHSSSLVEIDSLHILIDPVWDERASPLTWAGPKRFFPPTLPLEEMPPLHAVLISHDHFDHLGERTVRQLASLQPSARWITSLGVGAILQRFGVAANRITELDWTGSAQIEGVDGASCRITSVPARHFSGRNASNRFQTLWASFVLRTASHNIYYGADSGLWEGFLEIAAAHGPFDLTMLEIGAYDDLWKHIHMGPDGAAEAFRVLGGAGLLMPIHWGLFNLALHAWRHPMERLTQLADADGLHLWSPAPGQPSEVLRGVEMRSEWWRLAQSNTSPSEDILPLAVRK